MWNQDFSGIFSLDLAPNNKNAFWHPTQRKLMDLTWHNSNEHVLSLLLPVKTQPVFSDQISQEYLNCYSPLDNYRLGFLKCQNTVAVQGYLGLARPRNSQDYRESSVSSTEGWKGRASWAAGSIESSSLRSPGTTGSSVRAPWAHLSVPPHVCVWLSGK